MLKGDFKSIKMLFSGFRKCFKNQGCLAGVWGQVVFAEQNLHKSQICCHIDKSNSEKQLVSASHKLLLISGKRISQKFTAKFNDYAPNILEVLSMHYTFTINPN